MIVQSEYYSDEETEEEYQLYLIRRREHEESERYALESRKLVLHLAAQTSHVSDVVSSALQLPSGLSYREFVPLTLDNLSLAAQLEKSRVFLPVSPSLEILSAETPVKTPSLNVEPPGLSEVRMRFADVPVPIRVSLAELAPCSIQDSFVSQSFKFLSRYKITPSAFEGIMGSLFSFTPDFSVPVLAPKLDGLRMMAYFHGDTCVLWNRRMDFYSFKAGSSNFDKSLFDCEYLSLHSRLVILDCLIVSGRDVRKLDLLKRFEHVSAICDTFEGKSVFTICVQKFCAPNVYKHDKFCSDGVVIFDQKKPYASGLVKYLQFWKPREFISVDLLMFCYKSQSSLWFSYNNSYVFYCYYDYPAVAEGLIGEFTLYGDIELVRIRSDKPYPNDFSVVVNAKKYLELGVTLSEVTSFLRTDTSDTFLAPAIRRRKK